MNEKYKAAQKRKAERKEKRKESAKKIMADIKAKKDAVIAKNKKKRAENIANRKKSLERFTKPKKEAKTKTKTKSSSNSKSKSAPRADDKGGRLSARGSEGYKPTKTDIGPNMGKVNKPDTPKAEKFDRVKAARNQMNRARASMGFKKGGKIDGCATRGLTRAKRSR